MDNGMNVNDSKITNDNEVIKNDDAAQTNITEDTAKEDINASEEQNTVHSSVTTPDSTGAQEDADAPHEHDEEGMELYDEVDYSNYTKAQLVEASNELFKENSFRKVDNTLRQLKTEIDRINREEREEALKKFTADGGVADDFEFKQDELTTKFYANYKALKEKKSKYYNDLESKKTKNLEAKNNLIKEIKTLVESGDTTKASLDKLKEYQQQWKEIGQVPQPEADALYETYNTLLDRFYNQKSIENKLIELDRKRNLAIKLEICDKAERLLDNENINEAIAQLNKLHDEYKSVGPIPKEDQENVWQRFKSASDKLYDRKRTYIDGLKKKLEENMHLKQTLCIKIEEYPEFNSDKISDWNQKTKELLEIQAEWDKIGPAPREVAKDINKQFWSNFKTFFNNKNKFFERLEKSREQNLKLKTELCEKAEALKESAEWEEVTETLKNLQQEWKEIGPVPEAYRDSIYERFKAACDYFFNRKRNRRADQDKEFETNLQKKKEICDQIEALAKEKSGDVEKLEELHESFSDIGFVPRKNINSIQERLTKATEAFLNNMEASEEDKEKVRFSLQMKTIAGNPAGDRKSHKKEQILRKKIQNIENDISLWKNNLEFFANSKTADRLRSEFNTKISEASKELDKLKVQLKMLQQQGS